MSAAPLEFLDDHCPQSVVRYELERRQRFVGGGGCARKQTIDLSRSAARGGASTTDRCTRDGTRATNLVRMPIRGHARIAHHFGCDTAIKFRGQLVAP